MILASEDMSVFIASLSSFTQSMVGGMHLAYKKKRLLFIFVGARGKPGTKASILLGKLNFHYINGLNNAYEMTITYVCTT